MRHTQAHTRHFATENSKRPEIVLVITPFPNKLPLQSELFFVCLVFSLMRLQKANIGGKSIFPSLLGSRKYASKRPINIAVTYAVRLFFFLCIEITLA